MLFSQTKVVPMMIINFYYHSELSVGFAVPMHNIIICFMWKIVHSVSKSFFCFVLFLSGGHWLYSIISDVSSQL